MPNGLTVGTVKLADFKDRDFRKNDLDSPRSVNLGIVAGKVINACQWVGAWNFSLDEYKTKCWGSWTIFEPFLQRRKRKIKINIRIIPILLRKSFSKSRDIFSY